MIQTGTACLDRCFNMLTGPSRSVKWFIDWRAQWSCFTIIYVARILPCVVAIYCNNLMYRPIPPHLLLPEHKYPAQSTSHTVQQGFESPLILWSTSDVRVFIYLTVWELMSLYVSCCCEYSETSSKPFVCVCLSHNKNSGSVSFRLCFQVQALALPSLQLGDTTSNMQVCVPGFETHKPGWLAILSSLSQLSHLNIPAFPPPTDNRRWQISSEHSQTLKRQCLQ